MLKTSGTSVMVQQAILAIDASSDACSAALKVGDSLLEVRHSVAPRQHNKLLQQYIDELLDPLKMETNVRLAAIVVGAGPGSFAGIRIAAAIAQGVAIVHQIPIVGISSMQVMAWHYCSNNNSQDETLYAVVNDAKMGEFYLGVYGSYQGKFESVQPESLIKESELLTQLERIKAGALEGTVFSDRLPEFKKVWLSTHAEILNSLVKTDDFAFRASYPHAEALLALGERAFHEGKGIAPELFEPLYLRQADAWKTLEQQ